MKPKVTVLMPVRDYPNLPEGASYLKIALKGMAEQTYENLDLIVGDDGSTKSTTLEMFKLAQENYPDRVRVYRNASDQHGTAYALDIALAHADSDTVYLSKADGDDIFFKDREKNRVALFETLPKQVSTVYENFYMLNLEPRPHIVPVILRPYDYRALLNESYIPGNSCWRANVYERWGGPLKETFVYPEYANPKGCNKHAEDYWHWLALTDFSDAFWMNADPAHAWTYRTYHSSKYQSDRKHVDYARTYCQFKAKERRGLL